MTSKQFLKQLEKEHGLLTPELVVEAARPADSPIHKRFEWDDTEAAREYRLNQARRMIKVEIKIVGEKKVRAFKNVVVEVNGEQQRGYLSTEVVMGDEELRNQALAEAISKLEYWQNEYESLEELSGIINPKVYKKAKKIAQVQAVV